MIAQPGEWYPVDAPLIEPRLPEGEIDEWVLRQVARNATDPEARDAANAELERRRACER